MAIRQYIRKTIILLISFAGFLSSCEDVIEVDLNNTDPQIVIEAKLYDRFQPATVIITKTSDFFDTLTYRTVSGAEITIADNEGNIVNIPETDSVGIYSADFFGKQNKTYTLTVKAEGKTYTASAKMKTPTEIDSMFFKYRDNPLPYQDEGYELTCILKDSANYPEYAKLDVYKNQKRSTEIYLFEDTYSDGNNFEYIFYNDTFQENDTASVLVSSCDKDVYKYLYTYAEITSDFFHDTGTPYNPTSNISGGALGYFGVFSVSGSFIILNPE